MNKRYRQPSSPVKPNVSRIILRPPVEYQHIDNIQFPPIMKSTATLTSNHLQSAQSC